MKLFYILIGTLIINSCGVDEQNKVVGGNLSVYFEDHQDEELAEKVARYWKENDLISNSKQDLKLARTDEGYELSLIASDENFKTQLPFSERSLLIELQEGLSGKLKVKNLEIVICNSKFETLFNINE